MVRTLAELRAEVRIYTEAAHRESGLEMKPRLAGHALSLAQLAEQVQRERFVIEANIERYEHMLVSALDDGLSRHVDGLLNEERIKLAALTPTGRQSHVTAQFDRFLDEAIAVIGAEMGSVQVLDPVTGCLRIVASRGFDAPFLDFFAVVPYGDHCACSAAAKRADRVIVPDIERSPLFARQSGDVLREAGVRSVQSTPLVGRTGNIMGMVSAHWRYVSMPIDDTLKRLDTVIDRTVSGIEAT